MKNLIFVALIFFLGCAEPHRNLQSPKPPSYQQQVVKADGEYVGATMPCKCGDFVLYVPNSCPCFEKENYPDLAADLNAVYNWVQQRNIGGGKKIVGKYELLTLNCGCTLQVYVPGSSGCLEKLYPDLAVLLKTVYLTAKKHEGK